MEARSEIPNVESVTDTKGRKQPAKKPKRGTEVYVESRDAAGRRVKSPVTAEVIEQMRRAFEEPEAKSAAPPKPASDHDPDDPRVVAPEEFRTNILDTIDRHKAVARAYKRVSKKVLAVSKPDQALKDEISDAISALITIWQSVQRTFGQMTDDDGGVA
jgi:hypothetical protein